MIVFDNVTKWFHTKTKPRIIIENVSLVIPDGVRVGILGKNGAGKSTLLRLISGTTSPNKGRIKRTGLISWPLGFSASFHPALTGAQNTQFVARIYGRDIDELLEYVKEFADLGDYLHMPVRSYSSGMRARLAFGISMGVSFDCYLVDEITAVGDTDFKRKAQAAFENRLNSADLIMISHSPYTLRKFCTSGIVLNNGNLKFFENINDAIEIHEKSMQK